MKKTFYSVLRTMCVGAMTLFAVSCYDDSFLREDIAEIEDQVAGLVARLDSMEVSLNSDVGTVSGLEATLAALENSLKELIAANGADVKAALEAQIADLKTKLEKAIADGDKANADAIAEQKAALEAALKTIAEGVATVDELAAVITALEQQGSELQAVVEELYAKIAVVAVEEADGKVVLTLADGSKVEVSKPLTNVDNNGLVTIVEVDGVKYWQVVGAETHTGVVVGHPDQNIEFQINAETKELEYRVNGTEWISTGVVAQENAGAVITSFEETDDYVKFTIGDSEIVLPKYNAGSFDLTFGRDEVYFAYGATKKLALATEGVVEYYVMSKPDGWKASIEDGKVVVVAPTTAFIEMGVADAKGELLVHANTEAGACKVVKVDLVAGPGLTLSFADGVLKYFNALAGEQSNFWGDVWYDFQDVWFGIVTVDELLEVGSFEAFIASQPEPLGGLQTTLMNIFQTGYVEGEYEEFTAEVTLEQLVEESWCGYELAEGETYVVWAVPSGDATTPWLYEQAVYAVTDTYVDFVQGTPAYNNVPYTATFFGADGFAVGATSKDAFKDWVDDTYTYEMALQEFLMGSWQPGPLMNFNSGDRTAMGKVYGAGNHEINLKDILLPDWGQVPPVEPNTEYFVWVLPFVDGKSDYTFEDLQLVTCKTNPLAYSETLAPVVTIDSVASDAVVVTITPPANGQTAYELMTASDFEQFIDPEFGDVDTGAIAEYLKWNWAIESKYTEEYGSWFIEANTEYVLVTYNTANGEYSVTYEKFTTPGEAEVTVDTPSGKQWVFTSEYWDMMMLGGAMAGEYCFDLGVSLPTLYPEVFSDPNTAVIGINYEPMGAPAGTWMSIFSYGSYTITPTDETSGVMVWLGVEVPYYGYDGQSCTFDLGGLLGEDPGVAIIEGTLATTEIFVQVQ